MQLFGIPIGRGRVSATDSHVAQTHAEPSKKERGYRVVEIADRYLNAVFDMMTERIVLEHGGIDCIRTQERDTNTYGVCCTIAPSPDNAMLVARTYKRHLKDCTASLELPIAYRQAFLNVFRQRCFNDDFPKEFVKGASKERAYQDMDHVYYALMDVPTEYENVFLSVTVTLNKDMSDETIHLYGRLYSGTPLVLDFRGVPSMTRRMTLPDEEFSIIHRHIQSTLERIITTAVQNNLRTVNIDYVENCTGDPPNDNTVLISPDDAEYVLHDLFWFVGGLNRPSNSFATLRQGSAWKYATVANVHVHPQEKRTCVKLLIR